LDRQNNYVEHLDIFDDAAKCFNILATSECQVASRPDEVNCNVHETLAFNDISRHGDNSQTS